MKWPKTTFERLHCLSVSNKSSPRSSITFLTSSSTSTSTSTLLQPVAKLCATCTKVDIHSMLRDEHIGEHLIFLGTMSNIFGRAESCALCALITDVTRRTWLLDKVDYGPELDLSTTKISINAPRTGFGGDLDSAHALRIEYSSKPLQVLSAMEAAKVDLVPSLQIMQESAPKLGHPRLHHGRVIKDMVNLDLLREWLRICEHTHGEACESNWWREKGNGLPGTVRMIDVLEMKITPVPLRCRYVALSYLWGGTGESYWTSTENLPERLQPQGLSVSILPCTITDTILLIRLLGERYLWVDALCIVQDDPADKAAQIGVMESIYGLATLTIFAAGGTSVHASLPGLRVNTRKVHQRIENIQGILFSAALPGPNEAIAQTAWNTRGWTYQEIMLSRRRLIFTPVQVYFECSTDVWAEDVVAETEGEDAHGMPKFHRLTRQQAQKSPMPRKSPWLGWPWGEAYMRCVHEYTRRSLTNEIDIVDALTGVTTAIAKGLAKLDNRESNGAFRFGMPAHILERALLWQSDPDAPCTRRIINVDENLTTAVPWPSWAWAGWRGHIMYGGDAQFRDISNKDDYPYVDESLVEHWFIADVNGDLIHLDVKRTEPVTMDPGPNKDKRTGRPLSMIPWDSDWSQKYNSTSSGALVFRTSTAFFTVVYPQISGNKSQLIGCHHCIFSIMTIEDRPRQAGWIILPVTYPSSTVLQFAIICRGAKSRQQSTSEGDFLGLPLYVIALSVQSATGMKERVGVGIIDEDAWLKVHQQIEVIVLK